MTSTSIPAVRVPLTGDENSSQETEYWSRREEAEERLQGLESTEGIKKDVTVLSVSWSFKSKLPFRVRTACVSKLNTRRWFAKSILFLHIFIALSTTSFSTASATESCSKRLVMHTIRYKACIPKRQLSIACLGNCRSYATIDAEDPLRIQRTCSCCQATEFRQTRVPLQCPKPNGEVGYIRAVIRVMLPMACMCRPCAPLPEIQAAEFLS